MHEAQLIKMARQAGHGMPREIMEAPELLPSLSTFWLAYFDLRRGKTRETMLQWWEVQYWCDTHALDLELSRAVHRYLLEMDNIWASLIPKKPEPNNGVRGRH